MKKASAGIMAKVPARPSRASMKRKSRLPLASYSERLMTFALRSFPPSGQPPHAFKDPEERVIPRRIKNSRPVSLSISLYPSLSLSISFYTGALERRRSLRTCLEALLLRHGARYNGQSSRGGSLASERASSTSRYASLRSARHAIQSCPFDLRRRRSNAPMAA